MQRNLVELYKAFCTRLLAAMLLSFPLVSLTGCDWIIENRGTETPVEDQGEEEMEEEETEEPPEEEPEEEVSDDVVATITVLDENGSPLADVTASSSAFTIETAQTNDFDQLLLTLTPSSDPGMIILSKAGYLDGLVYLAQGDYSQSRLVTLMAAGEPIIVDGATGGAFSAKNGAAVEIDPESLQRPDGSVAFGDIELYITPVNTDDDTEVRAFPGSFFGAPEDIDFEVPIYSYGVVNMSFYQNDEELQLRDGFSADLTLPMYASQHIDGSDVEVGDSVPFWILNEGTGVWEQHGEALVVADPLSPTGFALNPTTTHFSWFNTDAWGNPGSGAGGSGGGGNPDAWCQLTVDVAGVDLDEMLDIQFERRAIGSPTSVINRIRAYDGSPIDAVLPRGTGYRIRVKKLDNPSAMDEVTVGCADGQPIFDVVDLDPEGDPVFLDWQVTVTPIFTADFSNDLTYEIIDNKVTFGGSFARDADNRVIVNAPFMTTPVELPPGAFFDEIYLADDPSPVTITARLDNDSGTAVEETQIEFIDFASPIVDRLVAFNTGASNVEFRWEVDGADSLTIYQLTEDPLNPAEIGIEYFPPVPELPPVPEDGAFVTSGLDGFEGYIRITFTNQYGDTDVYRYISPNIVCVPFSELPECIQAF